VIARLLPHLLFLVGSLVLLAGTLVTIAREIGR